MFNFFKSNSKLGIDIGTASIKVIEFTKRAGRFALSNYGLFEFKGFSDTKDKTETIGPDKNILKLPDQEIIWGLKEVLKKSRIKSSDAVASIPSFSTFATVIEMPYLSEGDLAKSIPFEAKKYIPAPLDSVELAWSIIGIANSPEPVQGQEQKGIKPATVEIFIAAVIKEEANRYKNIMQGAGLNLRAIELENSALVRALLGNDLAPTAIINIGGRSTSILIVDKGYERVSHNYEIGGFEITKSISRSLGISIDRAENLKKKVGLSQGDENIVNQAMMSLVDMMVFETKKTISSYEESKKTKVSKIILVGGLTNMPNFANYFKQQLGREVFMGNALARVVYPQELNKVIQEISSTFAVAAGLAMREI